MNDNLDVSEWIRYAQMDYDAAKNMAILHNPVPLEIVCYHCQQSAEKILKAYAIARGEPLIKTHDLNILLNQCKKYIPQFDDFARQCLTLTSYITLTRYPIGEDTVDEHDMNTALKDTLAIMDFTKGKLAELGYK
jgi:HEPN domain-containing protein